MEHPPRADHADLDGMPVVGATEVAGRATHGADGAVGEAHRDRVVQLDLGVHGRGHEGEHVLPTQVGEPERHAQQVGQLRLAVAAAAGLGPRPGVGLGHDSGAAPG